MQGVLFLSSANTTWAVRDKQTDHIPLDMPTRDVVTSPCLVQALCHVLGHTLIAELSAVSGLASKRGEETYRRLA